MFVNARTMKEELIDVMSRQDQRILEKEYKQFIEEAIEKEIIDALTGIGNMEIVVRVLVKITILILTTAITIIDFKLKNNKFEDIMMMILRGKVKYIVHEKVFINICVSMVFDHLVGVVMKMMYNSLIYMSSKIMWRNILSEYNVEIES